MVFVGSDENPCFLSTAICVHRKFLGILVLEVSVKQQKVAAAYIIEIRSQKQGAYMGYETAVLLFVFLCSMSAILGEAEEGGSVTVKGSVIAAETDDNFICATLDWWPSEKCDYGRCTWRDGSILNLDINHPFLENSIKAFKSLRIRMGGSLQDQVTYGNGMDDDSKCLPITKRGGGLFGFSHGCLSLSRWDMLNSLFKKTGATVTFGLNALYGRHPSGRDDKLWIGAWNSSNARGFMEYTVSHGYPVDSWEFGNELSGDGIGARVASQQYAKDLVQLKAMVDELYRNDPRRPLMLAPGGFFSPAWYGQLLEASGRNVVDVVTHHIYNLGAGNDPHLVENIINPKHLNGAEKTFREVQETIQSHGPWSSAWVGESGGAYNGGGYRVSNTFLDSFWYLDQLGMSAKYNTKVYCRQSLIGGNYGLLDSDTFVPNPDYYSALLWHRLMGRAALAVSVDSSPYLRAYAHCTKQQGTRGGITLLLINLSKTSQFSVSINNDQSNSSFMDGIKTAAKEEYHLTGNHGFHRTQIMLLNGTPLELTEDGDIPPINPVFTAFDAPLHIAPLSIAFVALPNFKAQACV